jgi:hypothetical protein
LRIGKAEWSEARLSRRCETVRVIDERKDGESRLLVRSNFSARKDWETGDVAVNLGRWFEQSPSESGRVWTSDAYHNWVRLKK